MCWQIIGQVAGQGASAYDNIRAAREQRRAVEGQLANDRAAGQEGGRMVEAEAGRLARSDGSAERSALTTGFMDALRGSQAPRTAPALGAVSHRFMSDLKNAQAATGAENRSRINDAAVVQGAGLQRQHEGQDFNRTASDLGLLADRMRGQDAIWQLRASLASPNPGLQAAGSLLSSWGQARASRASPQTNVYGEIDGK